MDHGQLIRRPGETIRLEEIDPGDTGEFDNEEAAQASEQEDTRRMVRLQDILMAHEMNGLLILFQGMDASGKDEAIRDVLTRLDPRGCEFKQFKKITEKEARHDYLWRAAAALPARGQIGIFNRSYYEHVTGERVHPERLEEQHLPDEAREEIWEKRFRHINHFEEYLAENGIHVLKFFLHVSKEEQRKRLLERIGSRETSWQFSQSDVEERDYWDEYQRVYSEALTRTNTAHAPWHLVPSDRRWFTRAAVASVIAAKLQSLHSDYPELSPEEQKELDQAREALEKDDGAVHH